MFMLAKNFEGLKYFSFELKLLKFPFIFKCDDCLVGAVTPLPGRDIRSRAGSTPRFEGRVVHQQDILRPL